MKRGSRDGSASAATCARRAFLNTAGDLGPGELEHTLSEALDLPPQSSGQPAQPLPPSSDGCTRQVRCASQKTACPAKSGCWRSISSCATWAARNCRQAGDACRGADPSAAAARIRGIVPCPPGTPGRAARPESAGGPNGGFPEPAAPPARGPRLQPAVVPECSGKSRRRCQASKVAGVTILCSRGRLGSIMASAAGTARSAQSGLERATCRSSTAITCRRTRISASLAAALRASSASQPNTGP